MSSPAAWHPDPLGRHEHRYWDGAQWTEHVADAGQLARDPLAAAPADGGTVSDHEASAAAVGSESPAPATEVPTAAEAATAQDAGTGGDAAGPPATTPSASESPQAPQAPQWASAPAGETGGPPATAGAVSESPQAPQAPQWASAPTQGTPPAQPAQWAAGPAATALGGGAPSPQPSTGGAATNGLAVTALILGLLSLLVSWIPFVGLLGVVGGLLGLVFGFVGRGRAKKVATGGGMALTGIITGVLAVLLGLASTALPVLFFRGSVAELEAVDQCMQQGGSEAACIEEHAPAWLRFLAEFEQVDTSP